MLKQTVQLDECTATVKELRVRDVVDMVANIKEVFDGGDINVQQLITERMDTLLDMAGNIVDFDNDKTILDLAFSEIQTLVPAIMDVNQAFFGQLALLGVLPTADLPEEATQLPAEPSE